MDPVVHFEIPYKDSNRIVTFYQSVFDWKLQPLGEAMGNYILATTVESNMRPEQPGGAINGGFYPTNPDWPAQHPSIVIAVKSIQESMNKISDAGGKVLGEPMTIQGIGQYVSFLDSEGNRCSILQTEQM